MPKPHRRHHPTQCQGGRKETGNSKRSTQDRGRDRPINHCHHKQCSHTCHHREYTANHPQQTHRRRSLLPFFLALFATHTCVLVEPEEEVIRQMRSRKSNIGSVSLPVQALSSCGKLLSRSGVEKFC